MTRASLPEEFEHLIATDENTTICPGDILGGLSGWNLIIRVYRPDEWPDGPVPLVVHHHGEGQLYDGYDYIGNRLAEEGYVFLSVTNNGVTNGSTAEQAIACAMSWIGSTEPDGGAALFTYLDEEENVQTRLRCDAVIMGHSQGGNAARRFVDNWNNELWEPYWFGFRPAALVGLAPSTVNAVPLPAEEAVPLLLFGAAVDNEGNPVALYDETPTEEERLPQSPARFLVWVHDAMHDDFGGVGFSSPSATDNAGTAAVTEYLPRFLQWHLENENVEENRRVLMLEEFPEPLNDPDYHDNANAYGDLGFRDCSGLADTVCAATAGCFWDEMAIPATCVELVCSEHVAPPDCESASGCVEWDGGCVPRPAIYGAYTMDTTVPDSFVERVEYFPGEVSETELAGSLVGLTPPQVSTGDVLTSFMPEFMGTISGHETSAMLVSWGPGEGTDEGAVSLTELALGEHIAMATHLSFRIANLASECEPPATEPVSVGVRLRNNAEQEPAYVDSPLTPIQRINDGGAYCAYQTMTTVRIPMSRFCQDDTVMLDTSSINEVEFFFDDHGIDRDVIIDSIEFTRHPDDVVSPSTGINACPLNSAVYACEATNTLVAEQTACSQEPLSGACPSPGIVTTGVSIPWADDGGSGFPGWLIHVPPGIIDDEENLTTSEETYLATRCIEACEDEWDDNPFVSANCDATGAFEIPRIVAAPSVGTRQAIPTAQQDGSDLFGTQILECSLHDSCCQGFDELGICPAAPDRVTPARERLGDGQEWELTILGSTFADSPHSTAMEPVSASMTGTIGYSFCTEGDGAACPFYIGSMHLELTEALELELECGGMTEMHEITELAFDLVQPALGISESGTSWKAFPPRAIVVEATGEADALPVYVRDPIELPVYYQAGEGWTQLQGEDGAYIKLEVPCNGEIAEVALWWGFDEDAVIEAPPIVEVDLPSTVACPDELELLLATGDDPDDDLESLEWIVDGVLMSSTWPTIDFTEAHQITAVLRDERGAATSDTEIVTCL